jgi:hypothetical protein
MDADATEPSGSVNRAVVVVATLATIGVTTWVAACASVPSDARIGIDAPSSAEDQFGPVSNFLDHRCGSLDCHGQEGRNLRIWGCEGMRLEPGDVPQCSKPLGGSFTTPDEHLETYRSLVGLEPALMSAVVADHGANPDLLTFIRKARGEESHKGGTLITPGDPQDACLTSWLQGNTDTANCVLAKDPIKGFPAFPPLDASAE